jgi:hypothetical protein
MTSAAGRLAPRGRALLVLLWVWAGGAAMARAQDASMPGSGDNSTAGTGTGASAEERLKVLTDPASVKQKLEKERLRPPLEFFRSQVAPFDILPFVKPNHWSFMTMELRANLDDYVGLLQTEPVALAGMPHAMLFRRDARLPKSQRMRMGLPILMPQYPLPRELAIEVLRPDSVRADETWKASLRTLDWHQMLVVVLTRGSNDGYGLWNRYVAFSPLTTDPGEFAFAERQRYYRMVLPLEPERPPLSSHPLTWSTISHVFWDGMSPETLLPGQQQAMLDWLHWGGQLVLIGGATPSFSLLRESFLDASLPADPSGDGVMLGEDALRELSAAFPPPNRVGELTEATAVPAVGDEEAEERFGSRYRTAEPIRPEANRPLYLAGLRPREGSTVIPLDSSSGRLLGVERRVGRGRVLMLAVNPTDAALASWPGLDTFIRRVMLRRPEEGLLRAYTETPRGPVLPEFAHLSGPQLSWYRLLSRDFTATAAPVAAHAQGKGQAQAAPGPRVEDGRLLGSADAVSSAWGTPGMRMRRPGRSFSAEPVAEWNDAAALPRLCRDELERASGITIPSSTFVLKVILAYLVALVPLNWLICRYVFGRREWAWIVVPVLALGFAVAVERAAAYDIGYDTACDEIDLVEVYGGYPRAHLSRFASLYSTGRARFSIAFSGDPTALALPLDSGRSLRGEDVSTSVWQANPPALEEFPVQPRSLAMFRAEQMVNLAGSITLEPAGEGEGGAGRVVNASELELRDAVLVDVNESSLDANRRDRAGLYLGTIAPGASVPVTPQRRGAAKPPPKDLGFDPAPLCREFRAYSYGLDRPENRGELRLVAWTPTPQGGLKLDPVVDRHRGYSVVVVHLRSGPAPDADAPPYSSLGTGLGPRPARETKAP